MLSDSQQVVMNNRCPIFSTAYFPPIGYFKALSRYGNGLLLLEAAEHYRKQSWRTRCNILSANGVLSLSVPVIVPEDKDIGRVEIDYSKDWLRQHERALVSAYNSTPFFEYYQDEIFAVLESGERYLFDLNRRIIECVSRLVGLKVEISLTSEYISDYQGLDLRGVFDPKKKELPEEYQCSPYYQVFSEKFGFVDGLSILDLLFNEGPNSYSFLD